MVYGFENLIKEFKDTIKDLEGTLAHEAAVDCSFRVKEFLSGGRPTEVEKVLHVRSGKLLSSIRVEDVNENESHCVQDGHVAPYGAALEFGAEIKHRRGKGLSKPIKIPAFRYMESAKNEVLQDPRFLDKVEGEVTVRQ